MEELFDETEEFLKSSDGRGSIILIDDINFLLECNNFKDVLTTICKIKDIAIVKNSHVFAVMNKSQIDERQIYLLEKEFIPVHQNNEISEGFRRFNFFKKLIYTG